MASMQRPPPTLQGVNSLPRAILPEPHLTPARPILSFIIPPIRIVTRRPDGQNTTMFMYPGSSREQFMERFLACYDESCDKGILRSMKDLLFMRQEVVFDVDVSVLQVSIDSTWVISIKRNEINELLTSAIDDPSRLRDWRGFSQSALPRYFADSARRSTYPALMLDKTQCWKRRAIWTILALAISFIAGYMGGGCATTQHCELGSAFGVGGVVLSVLLTVQAILLQCTS